MLDRRGGLAGSGAHAGCPIAATSRSALRGADGVEERPQLGRILVAGRRLGAAGGVDRVGVHDLDRLADVLRAEAAAEDQRYLRAPARDQRPSRTSPPCRRASPGAPAHASARRAGGSRRGSARGPARRWSRSTCAALMMRAPVRRRTSEQNAGPSSPCSCSRLSPSSSASADDLAERRVDEHAAQLDAAAQRRGDLRRLRRRAAARAALVEDHPERPSAELCRELGVLRGW